MRLPPCKSKPNPQRQYQRLRARFTRRVVAAFANLTRLAAESARTIAPSRNARPESWRHSVFEPPPY